MAVVWPILSIPEPADAAQTLDARRPEINICGPCDPARGHGAWHNLHEDATALSWLWSGHYILVSVQLA
jgi:hypothetical protein